MDGLARRWFQTFERGESHFHAAPANGDAEVRLGPALRSTLSQPGIVTAVAPPHVEMLQLALDLVPTIRQVADAEIAKLKEIAQTLDPLFPEQPRKTT